MEPQKQLPQGLTFDDVLLTPGYTDFSRRDIVLSTNLSKRIKLKIPLVSSPMDTVTESSLAIKLAQLGGIGIIHRNLSVKDQVSEIEKVKKKKLLVGGAVGTNKRFEERVEAIAVAGADVVVVDSAHGFTKNIIETVAYIKNKYVDLDVIAGNIATGEAAEALIKAGADGLRVGMGPGAICTTRIISGMGVPQISALFDVVKVTKKYNIPVIADGGIKYSGDMIKALAAGASTVMMGSFFASTLESPGKIIELSEEEVPSRFRSILKSGQKKYLFKEYRGMGSIGAMKKGAKVKVEDEYHGKDYYKDKILVAEGVEGLVLIKGSIIELVEQSLGGVKSGMYYVGAKNIVELWKKAKFIQITQASLTESHPHGLLITNPGKNY